MNGRADCSKSACGTRRRRTRHREGQCIAIMVKKRSVEALEVELMLVLWQLLSLIWQAGICTSESIARA